MASSATSGEADGTVPSGAPVAPGDVVVVKIGTSSVMRERGPLDGSLSSEAAAGLRPACGELALSTLALVVDALVALRRGGYRVVLVSSGAVGVGCRELGIAQRPRVKNAHDPAEKARVMAATQAYAAVGQSVLMRTYSDMLRMAGQSCAQVLLTCQDLGSEYQLENAKNTLRALLDMGVVPIINENDTVATEEIKYGDNDAMAMLVSTAVKAKWMFLLTDVDQLYTANPRKHPDARPIDVVPDVDTLKLDESPNETNGPEAGTQWGTGGIATKINAARLATAFGVKVVLMHGHHPERILHFVYNRPERVGTVFEPKPVPLVLPREQLVAQCLPPHGSILLTESAARDLCSGATREVHTFAIESTVGIWRRQCAVRVCDHKGREFGRGICNYGSGELNEFKGLDQRALIRLLGTPMDTVAIHSNDLAVFASPPTLQGAIHVGNGAEVDKAAPGLDAIGKHETHMVASE